MVSLISAPNQFRLPRLAGVFVVCPAPRQVPVGTWQNQTALKLECQTLGFAHSVGVVRRCRISANEDDSALEQEVLEFMLQSEDPDKFPTRKQLIEAGRRDLAEAIINRGGWMTRGWDLGSDDELEKPEFDTVITKWDSINANMGQGKHKSEFEINGVDNIEVSSTELKFPEISELEDSYAEIGSDNGSSCVFSNPPASSSGRSGETTSDGGFGIEGILNRLEKQRNVSLGFHVERKGNTASRDENDSGYPHEAEAVPSLENHTVAMQENMLSNPTNIPKYNGVRSSLEPDTWRSWSIQRAGFPDSEFEAAEIDFEDSVEGRPPDSQTDQIVALKNGNKEVSVEIIEDFNSEGKDNGDKTRSRLQNLELELSSALTLLRSNTDNLSQKVDHEHLPEEFRNLSDDWEFQENEVMKAQDRLRSVRARFAVLEGKVALAKVDTEKVIDEKQKRINNARKALKLLRSTCIVWPNAASEVLLTGSFDGWATQRKMEKLSNGTFCLWLRLYPGRYEIKFIVDGAWKVDPLRPIVKNDGNENNLLTIS